MVIYCTLQYTILYYVMSAGKFKSLKMGGLNDAKLQLTKTKIRNVSENVVFLKILLVCFAIE